MSTGTIIALSIVILSILLLVVVGFISYDGTKPTIRNLKKLNDLIKQKKNLYTRESEVINKRVTALSQDADLIQKELQEKSVHFQDFAHEQGEFQSSIRYLKNHTSEYSKGIATNLKDEIKEDGPKIIKSFKRAFKKTVQKQKVRRQIKRER